MRRFLPAALLALIAVAIVAVVLARNDDGDDGARDKSAEQTTVRRADRAPDRPGLRLQLEGRADGSSVWADRFRAKRGSIVQVRMRINNFGREETSDVNAIVRVPPALRVNDATIGFRPVQSPEPIFPTEGSITSAPGVNLGPFPPGVAGIVTFRARVTGSGGGTLRASAGNRSDTAQLEG